MNLFDFLPFRDEMVKVYHGLTDNATHTSENPVFSELRVRRYECSLEEVSGFIGSKIEHWVGWTLKHNKTAVGGMRSIRAEVSSFALLGMKIDVTFGLIEETDANGRQITTVNGKAHTNIDSKGDLGESRRMLRMILSSLDFEFRRQIVSEEDYALRSLAPKDSDSAFQQLFDETRLEHRPSNPKPKTIEFKKPAKQSVPFRASRPASEEAEPSVAAATPDLTAPETATGAEEPAAAPKISKPKITVISLKKHS